MVSEWMEDGNINEFIRNNPDVNRTELVCTLFEFCGSSTDVVSWLILRKVWNICMTLTSSTEI